jgi:hypothetical protein
LLAVGCGFRHGTLPGDSALDGNRGPDATIDARPDAPIDAPTDAPKVAIVYQQGAEHFANTEQTIALHYPNSQLNHSLNVVIVGWINPHTVMSVTDGTGNTYTRAGIMTLNGMNQALYYACGVAGTSTNTVTVKLDSLAQADLRILEYSGVRISGCLDQLAQNSGSTVANNSGAATTTAGYELLVASNTTSRTTTGGDASFTSRGITSFGDIVEDRVVGVVGSYTASATQDQAGDWVMQIATFIGQ